MSLTVAQQLFHVPYNVAIPNSYFYTKEYLEKGGFLTTGDAEKDRILMNELRYVYIPIAGMVMYHAQGATVRLVNLSDSVVIYEFLKQHLQNWNHVVQMVLNAPPAPVDDLQAMDSFASAIYPIASSYKAELKLPEAHSWSTGFRLFDRPEPKSQAEAPQQVLDPGHSMISDAIARSSFFRAKNRG